MMFLACPHDTGRRVWIMHRNKPTEVEVTKLAVQLVAPDGNKLVRGSDEIFSTEEELIASLDPESAP